jgi:hypothetical protein
MSAKESLCGQVLVTAEAVPLTERRDGVPAELPVLPGTEGEDLVGELTVPDELAKDVGHATYSTGIFMT